jgi:hypothetical protein
VFGEPDVMAGTNRRVRTVAIHRGGSGTARCNSGTSLGAGEERPAKEMRWIL